MPIYEYQCTECSFRKEVLQKISDEPLKVCPQCGKPAMKKMVSAAAFRLKGGGWYETDFKSGERKNVHDAGAMIKSPTAKPRPSPMPKLTRSRLQKRLLKPHRHPLELPRHRRKKPQATKPDCLSMA